MTTQLDNPYQALVAIGAEIDHHESDLYVRASQEALDIIRASQWSWSHFHSEADGKLWIEVPFAYEPFWTAKTH